VPQAQLLTQAGLILSKCGRPQPPSGMTCVDLYRGYYYPKYFPIPTNNPFPADTNEAKEISGDTTFVLRAISALGPQGSYPAFASPFSLYFQIRYPNGRLMQQTLIDMSTEAGIGSFRKVVGEIPCPPGSKFYVTLDAQQAGAGPPAPLPPPDQTVALLFEGAMRYYLKPDGSTLPWLPTPDQQAASLPRIFNSPNQNLLAPEWMLGDLDGTQSCPETPPGFEDEVYTYSGAGTFSSVTPVPAPIIIPIQRFSDFIVRNVYYTISATGNGIPCLFQLKLRTSLGYSYTDDFIPPVPLTVFNDWKVQGGSAVYVDQSILANGGNGETTLTVFLDGVRRRRKQS
jgi:hypothetical protein